MTNTREILRAAETSKIGAIPQYGGDCALEVPAGLTSALNQCNEATSQLAQLAENLYSLFGLSRSEKNDGKQAPVSSPKEQIDEYVDLVEMANKKLMAILNHINS